MAKNTRCTADIDFNALADSLSEGTLYTNAGVYIYILMFAFQQCFTCF